MPNCQFNAYENPSKWKTIMLSSKTDEHQIYFTETIIEQNSHLKQNSWSLQKLWLVNVMRLFISPATAWMTLEGAGVWKKYGKRAVGKGRPDERNLGEPPAALLHIGPTRGAPAFLGLHFIMHAPRWKVRRADHLTTCAPSNPSTAARIGPALLCFFING